MEGESLLQDNPCSVDLIVEAGWVLTMDEEDRVIPDGAVAVKGKRIVAVGPREAILRSPTARNTCRSWWSGPRKPGTWRTSTGSSCIAMPS